MSVFEAVMLLCFGAAWPVSIVRSWRSRSTKAKSPFFSTLVIIGYACGILHKLFFSRDIVMLLYLINLIMCSIDLALWFRNRRLEKAREAPRLK